MPFSSFRRLIGRHAKGSKHAGRPRPTFRPFLEILERRELLNGTFEWKGGTSTDWSDKTNWIVTRGTGTYPGDAGSTGDTALFDDMAKGNCTLNESLTVANLDLAGNFTRTLTIKSLKSLTIGYESALGGGALNFEADAWLNIKGAGANSWQGTDINSTGSPAAIYVYNGATFVAEGNASKLGASLIVGQDHMANDSAATANIADPIAGGEGQYGLNGNITLNNDANILIYKLGTINFNQDTNSATRGGIEVAVGSTSTITNYGTLARYNDNGNGGETLVIMPKTTGSGPNAHLIVGTGSSIDFFNDYIQYSGTFTQKGSIKGFVKKGGKHQITDSGAPGVYIVGIVGNYSTTDGIIEFDDNTPGSHGVLTISGSFQMSGGSINIPPATPSAWPETTTRAAAA